MEKCRGEVQIEEGRKRKRTDEEEKEQSSKEEVEDFVSDEAYKVIEKKILNKGFIGERGFKHFISTFKEVTKKRGWKIICEHMPPGRAAFVREFYANMVGRKGTQCCTKGKWVSFHRDDINQLLKLGNLENGSKFKKLKENQEFQKIYELLIAGNGECKRKTKTDYESITRSSLTKEAKAEEH